MSGRHVWIVWDDGPVPGVVGVFPSEAAARQHVDARSGHGDRPDIARRLHVEPWVVLSEGTEQVYAKGYADGYNDGRKCGCTIHGDREQPCENPADICYRCRWECWGDTLTVPPADQPEAAS